MKIITLVLLLAALTSSAQKNFKAGYIVLPGKDTTRGSIDYREWGKNPSSILFSLPSSQPRIYTIEELESFGIDAMDHYRKAIVTIDENPVKVADVTTYSKDLILLDTVALRILVQGSKVTLYEFVDFKPHYFIQQANGPIEELSYRKTQDSLYADLKTYNDFRMQLQRLAAPQGLTSRQIADLNRLEYKEKELVRFVTNINGSQDIYKSLSTGTGNNKPIFFAGAGAVFSNFKFKSDESRYKSMKFKNPVSFVITAGMDFFERRNRQNLFFRAELSVSQLKATGYGKTDNVTSTETNEYFLKQTNITPGFSVNYKFALSRQTKMYAGAGMGYNFSIYPEHLFVNTNETSGYITKTGDFPSVTKGWLEYNLRTGVLINSNFEFVLSGQIAGSFIKNPIVGPSSHPVFARLLFKFN